MDKHKLDDFHIYHRSFYYNLIDYLLVPVLFIALGGLSLLSYSLHPLFAISIACFACWSIVLLLFAFTHEHKKVKIILSSEGILVCTNHKRYASTWDSLHNLDILTMPRETVIGIRSAVSITVEENKGVLAALARSFPSGIEDEYFLPLSPIINIPTRRMSVWSGDTMIDFDKLAQTEFGRDLLHYAPHLFEDSKEKQKNG